jgi:hypothetical protein
MATAQFARRLGVHASILLQDSLVADARPQVASAARASGFVLQSADTRRDYKQVSYLDSQ